MALIKVNGLIIVPDKVTMIERKTGQRTTDDGHMEDYTGITIHFDGGGRKWIDDPTATMIEDAFEHYDSKAYSELPY